MVNPASVALLYPTLLTVLMNANYTIIPTEDGTTHLVKIDHTPLTLEQVQTLSSNLETITFTLFTRKNPTIGQILKLNSTKSIVTSNWRTNKPAVFVTHGWRSSGTAPACILVRNAYLKAKDYNIVVIDWSTIAGNLSYRVVALSVPNVAAQVANFIRFIRRTVGLRTLSTKLVGHSLGAHVSSLAAKVLSTSSRVAEVVALDPASPMFESKGPEDRVDRTHAVHVQVLHTSVSRLGISKSVGTSDFFANDGANQPGCGINVTGQCAHQRAYEYFSESIMNKKGFRAKSENGTIAYMGGPILDPRAKGTYYFKTNSEPPYARG